MLDFAIAEAILSFSGCVVCFETFQIINPTAESINDSIQRRNIITACENVSLGILLTFRSFLVCNGGDWSNVHTQVFLQVGPDRLPDIPPNNARSL